MFFIVRNNEFIELVAFHLDIIARMKLPVIVACDMNLILLNPNNYAFVNSILKLGLSPVITIPTENNTDNVITRISILDQIWISHSLQHEQSFVNPFGITDHFPGGVTIKLPFVNEFVNHMYRCRPLLERGEITFSIL